MTPTRLRRFGFLLFIIGIGTVVFLVGRALLAPSDEYIPSTPEPPSTATASAVPNNLGIIADELGPFKTIPTSSNRCPDTQAPAVLVLKQDGSIAASQKWQLLFSDSDWTKLGTQPTQIQDAIAVTGECAVFTTDIGRIFTVRLGQAFVFEHRPDKLYVIRSDGSVYSIDATRIAALKREL